jgi:hypothetical protein
MHHDLANRAPSTGTRVGDVDPHMYLELGHVLAPDFATPTMLFVK